MAGFFKQHPGLCPPALALLALAMFGCGPDFSEAGLGTEIDFRPERPTINEPVSVDPYRGDDTYVLEAQDRFRTGLDIHRKIIWRTCTPNDGVCHNKKEYPDLHTPANFLAAINAPCNLQPGEFESVYDRCERKGDMFQLSRDDFGGPQELAWIHFIAGEEGEYSEEAPPTVESPGIHIRLRNATDIERANVYSDGQFLRTFSEDGVTESLVVANFSTRWWLIEGGTHLVGEVRNNRSNDADNLTRLGIRQGDLNRNGVFGADESDIIKMLDPGNPEESYLIARVRGEMNGEQIPGSRMPLANQPLSISEMLALFCFVEGLPQEGMPELSSVVDYAGCSYSADPEGLNLLGEGVTWETRISKILEANCGGCHGGASPDAGLDLLSEDAFDRLLEPSTQKPELNLVEPSDYENSYLWHKLNDYPDIVGLPMPYNPLTGEGSLTEAELGDIQTWIAAGAVKDE